MNAGVGRLHNLNALVGVAAVLLVVSGCKEQDPGFEIVTLEGKIEAIEHKPDGTGLITVRYYSERHETEVSGTGLVTHETQININGVASTLKDVREGDRARGEVRIEKKGDSRVQIALKITVDRPKPVGPD